MSVMVIWKRKQATTATTTNLTSLSNSASRKWYIEKKRGKESRGKRTRSWGVAYLYGSNRKDRKNFTPSFFRTNLGSGINVISGIFFFPFIFIPLLDNPTRANSPTKRISTGRRDSLWFLYFYLLHGHTHPKIS